MQRLIFLCFVLFLLPTSIFSQENRTYDGYGNNIINPKWGAQHSEMVRVSRVNYADGAGMVNDSDMPNPRHISNSLFDQQFNIFDSKNLSDYIWVYGQFIDHDITLSESNPAEPVGIQIPQDDQYFPPGSSIYTFRSMPMEGSGTNPDNPRRYSNGITSFVDGSAVYGSEPERALWLRTGEGGKLKTSSGNMLPWNTTDGEFNSPADAHNSPFMGDDTHSNTKLFVAGDVRANENPLLISMHTLFLREHNRICDVLQDKHPGWTDEQLYQKARKMVGAYIQNITFNEWLPAMGVYLPEYRGYQADMDPRIFNEFATAAFRIGHTLLNSNIMRMDNDGEEISQGHMTLKDAFFNPLSVVLSGGIEPFFKGMGVQPMQELDCKVINDVRNFLFGAPGAGGLDLAALNIYRGRDRGLPNYNAIRADFGLLMVDNFSELTSSPEDASALEALYGDVNSIDPWVGMLAEKHMEGAIFGELVMAIIKKQFHVLRDGDRFYFENDPAFSSEDLENIRKTTMYDILMRNTGLSIMQKNVFKAMPHQEIPNGPDLMPVQLEAVAFPNPASESTFLKVYAEYDGTAVLRIMDSNGRLVRTMNTELVKGDNFIPVSLEREWPRGLYNILIEQDQYYNIIKLIKE